MRDSSALELLLLRDFTPGHDAMLVDLFSSVFLSFSLTQLHLHTSKTLIHSSINVVGFFFSLSPSLLLNLEQKLPMGGPYSNNDLSFVFAPFKKRSRILLSHFTLFTSLGNTTVPEARRT